jgi:hypothetical protein
MALNKSSIYGKYGGVTRNNYYTPPPSIPYEPKSPPVIFRQQDKEFIEAFQEQATFIGENIYNILLRNNTVSIPDGGDDIDTFVMSTSGKPEDKLEYTSDTNIVTLDTGRIDGGFI